MAGHAYQALLKRGFKHSQIYTAAYKPDLDFNQDGRPDVNMVDAPITLRNLRASIPPRDLLPWDIQAAFDWAKEQGDLDSPLLVIFIGHGETSYLRLHPEADTDNHLTADFLNTQLSDYQSTGNQVLVLLEACYSGTIARQLQGNGRAIISSTGDNLARYQDLGRQSFINFYFDLLRRGWNFKQAFDKVKLQLASMDYPYNLQQPLLFDQIGISRLCLNGCDGNLTGAIDLLPSGMSFTVQSQLNLSIEISYPSPSPSTSPGLAVKKVQAYLHTPANKQQVNEYGHPFEFEPIPLHLNTTTKQWLFNHELKPNAPKGIYKTYIYAEDSDGIGHSIEDAEG